MGSFAQNNYMTMGGNAVYYNGTNNNASATGWSLLTTGAGTLTLAAI